MKLRDEIDNIRQGKYRQEIEKIRNEPDEEKQKELKKRLPGFIAAGEFSRCENAGWERASALMTLDCDGVKDPQALRDTFGQSPHVVSAFISPRGNGVKTVIAVPVSEPNEGAHRQLFKSACKWAKTQFGVQPDDTPDPCRLCFVSYDPGATWNPEATPLDFEQGGSPVDTSDDDIRPSDLARDMPIEDVREYLNVISPDSNYPKWRNLIWAVRAATKASDEGFQLAIEWSKRGNKWDKEAGQRLRDIWNAPATGEDEIGPGTLVHYAKEAGYKPKTVIASTNQKILYYGQCIDRVMKSRGLSVSVDGSFIDAATGGVIDYTDEDLCDDAISFGSKDRLLQAEHMYRAVRQTIRAMRENRRNDLIRSLTGKPSTVEGDVELRKFIVAVCGRMNPVYRAVLRHLIYSVKMHAIGKLPDFIIMPIFHGPQGHGKGTAIEKLCSPWRDLVCPDIKGSDFSDERARRKFGIYLIGICDELKGFEKADTNGLKSTMTARDVVYRPMRSNGTKKIPRIMSFIGSSNYPVSETIRDSTGMRRFFQVDVMGKMDWGAINGIDYNTLWESASELEKAPYWAMEREIRKGQAELVVKDPVARWLDEFEYKAGEFYPTHDLFSQFDEWMRAGREFTITRETFGRRMKAHGWMEDRKSDKAQRARGYVAPEAEL